MNAVLILIAICLMATFLYFAAVGARSLFEPFGEWREPWHMRRFSILIPARNEERVIGNLIRSLQEQDYPKEMFEIYTVINNSTDRTFEEATIHSSRIIVCNGTIRTKGDAISEAIGVLDRKGKQDAYVVFDADNVVDPRFLESMNRAIDQGFDIVQGRRKGKNAKDNIISKSYELFYMMQNVYFNHPRSRNGRSAVLNGTGWAMTSDWVHEHGYHPCTVTEDLEMTAIAALESSRIGFAYDAVTYDEYPNSLLKVFNQLPRWVYGQVECMRKYAPSLFGLCLKSQDCLEM